MSFEIEENANARIQGWNHWPATSEKGGWGLGDLPSNHIENLDEIRAGLKKAGRTGKFSTFVAFSKVAEAIEKRVRAGKTFEVLVARTRNSFRRDGEQELNIRKVKCGNKIIEDDQKFENAGMEVTDPV